MVARQHAINYRNLFGARESNHIIIISGCKTAGITVRSVEKNVLAVFLV